MSRGDCETGWAEFKVFRNGKIHVETSQHQWMQWHCYRVPCFFFVEVEETSILVIGAQHHQKIDGACVEECRSLAEGEYKYATCRDQMITKLVDLTKRHV